MGRPALNKLLQYTWQRANLDRNYNENAQNINYASILINPEIPGLAEPQSRDFGIGKKAGIPGFRDPGIPALVPITTNVLYGRLSKSVS